MKLIKYDQIPITLNGISILASRFTASQRVNLAPIYTLGRSGLYSQSPSGSRSYQVSFDYTPVFQDFDQKGKGDFLTSFLTEIKDKTNSSIDFFTLDLAGVSSEKCILNSLSFSLAPYSLITFSIVFDVFGELEGLISKQEDIKEESSFLLKSPNSIEGVSGSDYTKFTLSPQTQDSNLLSISYSISLQYTPVSKIGQEFPLDILYQKAEENANIVESKRGAGLEFRGTDTDFSLNLNTLNQDYYYVLEMKNPIIVSESSTVSSEGFLTSSKQIRSYY